MDNGSQQESSLIIEPGLSASLYGFSGNPGIGDGNVLDALECFLHGSKATIESIKYGYVPAYLRIQACCFQDWGETRLDKINGFKIRTGILLMIASLAQDECSDQLALCANGS